MTGPVRFGELLDPAAVHLAHASLALARGPVEDSETAAATFRDVAHSVRRLVFEMLGGTDTALAGLRTTTPGDPGLGLNDALKTTALRWRLDVPRPDDGVGGAWSRASDAVGAAVDILATQRTPDGGWRGPDSWQLDTRAVRQVGLAHVAALVGSLVGTVPLLVHRSSVERFGNVDLIVAEARGVMRATAALLVRHDHPTREDLDRLRDLGVARPGVRSDRGPLELADRLGRIRYGAWTLTRTERPSVSALADLAVLGVVIHQQAANLLPHPPGDIPRTAARWRLIHQSLTDLHTAAPPVPGIRADVTAVRELLRDAKDDAIVQVLVTLGLPVLGEVSDWSRATFEHLAATRQLHVPARLLTGDEVRDNPVLVAARLSGRTAPAPPRALDRARVAYNSLIAAPDLRLCSLPIDPMPRFGRLDAVRPSLKRP